VTKNETYTLTAVGQGNCTATDQLTVRILKQIEVPNAFSPNGDGINDRWAIPNLADYPGSKVEVFNRWGQQIFLSYGYNSPWDGSYLGKPLPLATYYYIITLNNGFAPVTGSVTIIK
jgi:gliding motility-associated-like protein